MKEANCPKRKISLLLSDVDGTLLTKDKVLTARAIEAVAELGKAGILFVVTSGRPPRGMAMLIEPLRISTLLAGFNGGTVVRPDLSVLQQRTLSPDVTREALALVKAHGLDPWIYTAEDWLVTREDAPHVAHETWTVRFDPIRVEAFSQADLDRAVKVVGVSDDFAAVEAAECALQAALGGTASASRSQPYYLDVTHARANKGDVVQALSERFDLPTVEIATIGDMPNDVAMFRRSGFSIAMGNASAEVKAQASVVTTGFDDEGFARAIERYLLP